MATPFSKTTDGFETQFGTNHLGHFVLVNRLASLLRRGSRVIVLASSGHRFADVDLDDPNFERTPYDAFVAYGRAKTANILFTIAFDRRHRARGVRAAAIHPGAIHTELGRHLDAAQMTSLVERINSQFSSEGKGPFQFKTIPQGAATSVWAAVVASADEVGGQYCENCKVGEVVDDDIGMTAVSDGVRRYALDVAKSDALWRKTEEMIGESF